MEENVKEKVPDSFVPIKAWRLFRYVNYSQKLHSFALQNLIWESAEPESAVCKTADSSINRFATTFGFKSHPECIVPEYNCSCGYYSYKDKSEARAELILQEISRYQDDDLIVIGQVEIWGKIIVHDKGYRSQYIKILELWLPASTTILVAKNLKKQYKIPFNIIEGSEQWLKSERHEEKSSSNPYQSPSQIQPSTNYPWMSPVLYTNPTPQPSQSRFQIPYHNLNLSSPIVKPSGLAEYIIKNNMLMTPDELTEHWKRGRINDKEYRLLLETMLRLRGGK